MKANTRFTKSIVETAGKETVTLPWTRGARRAAFINRRQGNARLRKTA